MVGCKLHERDVRQDNKTDTTPGCGDDHDTRMQRHTHFVHKSIARWLITLQYLWKQDSPCGPTKTRLTIREFHRSWTNFELPERARAFGFLLSKLMAKSQRGNSGRRQTQIRIKRKKCKFQLAKAWKGYNRRDRNGRNVENIGFR